MIITSPGHRQSGFSMMEVMITMLIILIGLLGIVALQSKAQQAELESYQRAQALIMLSDIVDRINVNRETLSCFQITTNTGAGTPFIGGVTGETGHTSWPPACTASTATYNALANADLVNIDNMLQGTSERSESTPGNFSVNSGGMQGARACISYDATTELGSPGTGQYTIVVSWQAMGDLVPPAANCANGLYGLETRRRAVSSTIRIADLL